MTDWPVDDPRSDAVGRSVMYYPEDGGDPLPGVVLPESCRTGVVVCVVQTDGKVAIHKEVGFFTDPSDAPSDRACCMPIVGRGVPDRVRVPRELLRRAGTAIEALYCMVRMMAPNGEAVADEELPGSDVLRELQEVIDDAD